MGNFAENLNLGNRVRPPCKISNREKRRHGVDKTILIGSEWLPDWKGLSCHDEINLYYSIPQQFITLICYSQCLLQNI